MGLAAESRRLLSRRARGRVRAHRRALPRRRPPAAALGRLPPRARDDRVLEGPLAPPARPLPVLTRARRVAPRAALAVTRPTDISRVRPTRAPLISFGPV